jgi:hypothetical protein
VLTSAIATGLLCLAATGVSAQAATPTVGGYFSTNTHGCGNVKLYEPNQNQFTAQQVGFNPKSIPLRQNILNKMAGKQVHYLTSLDCKPGSAHHTLSTPARPAPATPSTLSTSTNWSGYDVDQNTYAVAQTWVQPGLDDGNSGAMVDTSIWPGIGGESGQPLVQDGTEIHGTCTGNGGCDYQQSPYFWLEIVPDDPTELEVVNLALNVGDTVSAETDFDYTTDTANFFLCDDTTGYCVEGSQVTANGETPGNTAEWIAERATFNGNQLPELDRWNGLQVEIDGAQFLSGNVSGTGTPAMGNPMAMTTCDNQAMATPGGVGSNANGPYFVDYWNSFGHPDVSGC